MIIDNTLPELRITLSSKMIVMGATATRDWQPIHHDTGYARESADLPDIIMNNYTQAAWLSRYVTDWSGPDGRLARMKFSMRSPLCPGDEAVFRGEVAQRSSDDQFEWFDIRATISVGSRLATKAAFRLAMPGSEQKSPWLCPERHWLP